MGEAGRATVYLWAGIRLAVAWKCAKNVGSALEMVQRKEVLQARMLAVFITGMAF